MEHAYVYGDTETNNTRKENISANGEINIGGDQNAINTNVH